MRRLLIAGVLVVAGGSGRTYGQTPAPPDQSAHTFDVASVKPNKAGPYSPQRAGLPPGERVTMINVPLLVLVQIAYPAMSAIIGGPQWMGSPGQPNLDADRFDLNAKTEAPASTDQLRVMLQALLAERFKLGVHTELRQVDVYALGVARADGKLGPNLHRAAADCRALIAADKNPTPGKHPCGTVGTNTPPWHVRGVPITQLLIFRLELGRPIVDKTGLTGPFDFDLNWTPQWALDPSFSPRRFPDIDLAGPNLFTALQEQLGLKLVSAKDEQSVLVIDHVERPTPD